MGGRGDMGGWVIWEAKDSLPRRKPIRTDIMLQLPEAKRGTSSYICE